MTDRLSFHAPDLLAREPGLCVCGAVHTHTKFEANLDTAMLVAAWLALRPSRCESGAPAFLAEGDALQASPEVKDEG